MRFKHFVAISAIMASGAFTTAAHAEAGDNFIRLRGIVVSPTESSSGITPAFPAEHVAVNDSVMPEIDFTHMVSNNVGFELIAATTKHNVSGTSGTTGGIGNLASTWVLPPTLTMQYHFAPEGKVRPYVGAGVNYTVFYSEKATPGLVGAVGPTTVSMTDSFGWAAQAGVDVDIGENVFLNLDVKYIDIDTTATLSTTAAGVQTVRAKIDPLVFGAGIGFKF